MAKRRRRKASSGRRRRRAKVRRPAARRRRRRRAVARTTFRTTQARRVTVSNPRKPYRRNPGFSARGAIARLMEAGKTAAFVVVGKAATNVVAGLVPFGNGNRALIAAKKAGVGLILTTVLRNVVGPRNADAMLVGAILSPIEELAAGLPVIGPALSPSVAAGVSGYSRVGGGQAVRRLAGYSRGGAVAARAADPFASVARR